MKVAIVSKFDLDLKQKVLDAGLEYSEKNPDLVISLGGDGTFLRSERKYPGVPKLLAKESKHCKKCAIKYLDEKTLERIKTWRYKIKKHNKLKAKIYRKGKKVRVYTCTNDFIIRNKEQIYALRFSVWLNGKPIGEEIIGDGMVIATSFGSTGYFKSISRKSFKRRGIGIAFNNPTEKVRHRVVKDDSKIKVKILRVNGVFSSDNDPKMFDLKVGDIIEIEKSPEECSLVKF